MNPPNFTRPSTAIPLKLATPACLTLKVISSHDHYVLKKAKATTNERMHCRDKNQCPLDSKCLTTTIAYQAAITTKDTAHQTKNYIGVTAGPFKDRSTIIKSTLTNILKGIV